MMRSNPGRRNILDVGVAGVVLYCLLVGACTPATAAWLSTSVLLLAQQPAQIVAVGDANSEKGGDIVFPPADRATVQKLTAAQQLLQQRRYGEAVSYLGAILDGPEDYFFQPNKTSSIYRSLKAEAQHLLAQMPREGRELYELEYGPPAQQMLAAAVAAGDMTRIGEVSRRFFHTRSGYEATFLLGLNQWDCGQPLAGALTLARLRTAVSGDNTFEPALSMATATCWLQAGMADKARTVLIALRAQHPGEVTVGGRKIPLFSDDAQCIDWLVDLLEHEKGLEAAEKNTGIVAAKRWLMYRGDPARNAMAVGSVPLLDLRWRVTGIDDPQAETAIDQFNRCYQGVGVPAMPALHPLAVDNLVLMRTARTLVAVDFQTGKRLWDVPVEGDNVLETGVLTSSQLAYQSPSMAGLLWQRILTDLTYGTLSSDGRCVFSIEDLDTSNYIAPGSGIPMAVLGPRKVVMGRRAAGQTTPCNRLAAHDIHTGKLKWHIGGAGGQFALRQAETFFLGPPLPLMGQLYVIAEVKGEIRLLALEADTGKQMWSQPLAMVAENVLQNPLRRTAGISPSYADGILVCPTAAGAIVGVDLATRSLLWGYRYEKQQTDNPRMMNFMAQPLSMRRNQPSSRWTDSCLSICEGRVLVSPVESKQLHCLNLIDGSLAWTRPREDDLYVACIANDNAILVGSQSVRALRLADGQPAWDSRKAALPAGSTPSGRGCLCDNHYYLPLSSAEILTIDTATGKAVRREKSRQRTAPGNLVYYKGRVLSQELDGLTQFYQHDAAVAEADQLLQTNPNDPDALTLRGAVLLDAGQRTEATVCFRRAVQHGAPARAKENLCEILLEGLRTDFAQQRHNIADLESLLETPHQRAAYLRLMATGLQNAGESTAAFAEYQKLLALAPTTSSLDVIDRDWAVRRDRWFQTHLPTLRNAETAPLIDAELQKRMQAALAAKELEPLQRFLDYFGNEPAAAPARQEAMRRYKAAGQWLAAEWTLWQNAAPHDTAQAGKAVLAVTELLADAHCLPEAALGARWLERRFGDVVCAGDKTGQQWVAALPAASPLRHHLTYGLTWPVGKVDSQPKTIRGIATAGYGRYAVEIAGDPGPFLFDANVQFDQTRRLIVCNDNLGRERWQVSLAADKSIPATIPHRGAVCARAYGHMLFVVVGFHAFAIDMLQPENGNDARILWHKDLTVPGVEANDEEEPAFAIGGMGLGAIQQFGLDPRTGRGNILGPVTAHYATFLQFRSLVAFDPLTGNKLWVRNDIPPGSEIVGDDEYILVLPPDRDTAMLLRAADGELLGTRSAPCEKNNDLASFNGVSRVVLFKRPFIETIGCRLLLWQTVGSNHILRLFDPIEGKDVWPVRKFTGEACIASIGTEAVGILEPNGQFLLLGLPDGRELINVKLQPEKSLSEISLLRAENQYFLLAHSQPSGGNARQRPMLPVPGHSFKVVSRGALYAFDSHGKLQWPRPTIIQNQHFLADQPDRLPILVFACQCYEQRANGRGGSYRVSIMCIDKRNGRTAYSGDLTNQTGLLTVVGDPDKNTVTLNTQRNSLTLTFTDQPLPPETPAKKPENAGTGLWDSLRRTVSPLFGQPDNKQD